MERTEDLFSTESPYQAIEISRRKRLVLGVCQRALYYLALPSIIFISLLFVKFSIQLFIAVALFIGIIPAVLLTRKLALADNPDKGSLLFIGYMIVVFFTNSLLVEGFHSYIVPGYIVLVILSGMVLPSTRSFQISAVVSLFYLISQILTTQNLARIELSSPMESFLNSLIVLLAYAASAISIDMSTRDLRKSLDDATQGLIESNQALEHASAMKSQFTARTSHELKTPLSSIIVFTDLALREAYGPLNEKLRTSLEFVVSSARRLKQIINNILDLSKLEAGELNLDICPLEFRKTVMRPISKLSYKAENKGIDFRVQISDNLPEIVLGDEERIKQIIYNLVENAINFTQAGIVEVRIGLINKRDFQISVKDTGEGIPYEYQKYIFEPYHKFEPVPGSMESTGLGLAVTKHLVDLMSGTIQVKSTIGKGTTAIVTLPLATP